MLLIYGGAINELKRSAIDKYNFGMNLTQQLHPPETFLNLQKSHETTNIKVPLNLKVPLKPSEEQTPDAKMFMQKSSSVM